MTILLFDNSYAKLASTFYRECNPTPVANPDLIQFNQTLADFLGLEDLHLERQQEVLAGNTLLEGFQPIAMTYAGHQFGHFNSQLGDGRAILLGEVIAADQTRYFIQLKGSGRTPFSRGGDGRSALGPVLREYLLSEAMHQLGIATTRALAAVTTGEEVARDQLVAGGILMRVAKGFVRVGTFEYFSARNDLSSIQQLADYEIEHHYPNAKQEENRYIALFSGIVDRQAKLIASWMNIGFIHGVMNTDNMSIVGETIDYGPCAFMDGFHYQQVFSSIDRQARYAYHNQATIGQWNLTRLAEALLPLFSDDTGDEDKDVKAAVKQAEDILNDYSKRYKDYWLAGMRRKLGLLEVYPQDQELTQELLDLMHQDQADFTLVFFYLSQDDKQAQLMALFTQPEKLAKWLEKWQQRCVLENGTEKERKAIMRSANPVYIPRNHQVEAAIRAAEDHQDFSVFHALHQVLQTPYTLQPDKEQYQLPPKPEEVVQQTFCGT
ncbi:MAG: YdiU family protein [Cocleimonas sp.]|nr:YdiU family protein [Cocleimonas sp.]